MYYRTESPKGDAGAVVSEVPDCASGCLDPRLANVLPSRVRRNALVHGAPFDPIRHLLPSSARVFSGQTRDRPHLRHEHERRKHIRYHQEVSVAATCTGLLTAPINLLDNPSRQLHKI